MRAGLRVAGGAGWRDALADGLRTEADLRRSLACERLRELPPCGRDRRGVEAVAAKEIACRLAVVRRVEIEEHVIRMRRRPLPDLARERGGLRPLRRPAPV